ncbi:glycoside hydrolase family 26 protein [Actinotalea sp. M2MS4P-6]|uniref:glycoside hydrolase family 26 protein n=1 Tax=Actinotalea sp. M2MS4P-6 TaxID=2983762 RepID=UPI0021E4B8BD|nr:glycoside hydrolase family 26 protein [Actinotalea sp. M2MS4P-6]MCV2396023.1 glycoside hydrolase family 26 protein [Actinotalea sp. M2MS4P-6]
MSSRGTRQWWAGGRLSRRSRVATTAIGMLLAVVSVTVWLSPGGPATGAALTSAEAEALAAQVADLNKQLADAQDSLAARDDEIASLQAAKDSSGTDPSIGDTSSGSADSEAQTEAAREKAAAERAAAAAQGRYTWALDRAKQAWQEKATAEQDAAASQEQAAAADGRADYYQGLADARLQRAIDAEKNAATPTPTPTPTEPALPSTPSLAELLHPSTRQFGLYTTQSPFNWAEWDDIVGKVGVKPTIAGYFQGWDKPFRPDAVIRSWQRGAMPLLSWESIDSTAGNDQPTNAAYNLPSIINGTYDDYLHQYAKDVADLGLPLAIRLDHEMNGSWYPWGERSWGGGFQNGNSKGDYVKMWRHVHDIFEEEGANAYVIWVWAPNIVNRLPDYAKWSSWYMASLYPGDDYVDWVGLSGYFRPPYASDQTPTFSYTFDRSLAQLREVAPGKPILLAEVGASEIGDQKPAWLTSFFDAFTDPKYDDVIGFAWFNHAITTYSGGTRITNDWRIDSRRDSLQAFIDGITDPAAGFVAGGAEPAAAEATPDATAAATAAATPDPSPTATAADATASPSPTPSPSSDPSATAAPDPSATADPSATPDPSPSPEPSSTPDPSATADPTADPTATPEPVQSSG